MKNMLKKSLRIGLLGSACLTAPIAQAGGWPVIDVSSIAEYVKEAAEEAKREAARIERFKLKEKLDQWRFDQQTDNDNNIAANTITRTTQAMYDIDNKNAIKEALPAPTACESETEARETEQIRCVAEKNTIVANARAMATRQNGVPWNLGKTPHRTAQHVDQELVSKLSDYEANFSSGPHENYPVRADVFMGSTENCFTAGSTELAGMNAFVDYVTEPVAPGDPPSGLLRRWNTNRDPEAAQSVVRHMSDTAKIAASKASLLEILKLRVGIPALDGECILKNIKDEVHVFSKDETIAATSGQNQTVAQNIKMLTHMTALLARIETLQLESNLRRETLQAVILADQVK